MLTCPWFDRVCVTPHVTQQKEVELCVRSTFLCVVEFLGGYGDFSNLHRVHEGPQSFAERPCMCDSIFKSNILLFEPGCGLIRRLEHNSVGPLRLHVGRHFETLPVLELPVQLRQPRVLAFPVLRLQVQLRKPPAEKKKQGGLVTRTSASVS